MERLSQRLKRWGKTAAMLTLMIALAVAYVLLMAFGAGNSNIHD